jgi:YggT family protein
VLVVYYLILAYEVILVARLIMDYVMAFSRSYRPSGVVAVLFEFVYTATDPPLKLLRRFIPPLRAGNFSLDLSFMVLFIGLEIVRHQLR